MIMLNKPYTLSDFYEYLKKETKGGNGDEHGV
jgi:hypothetical protein